jgi:hypothetical protein
MDIEMEGQRGKEDEGGLYRPKDLLSVRETRGSGLQTSLLTSCPYNPSVCRPYYYS